jgi:hypothetical protein
VHYGMTMIASAGHVGEITPSFNRVMGAAVNRPLWVSLCTDGG